MGLRPGGRETVNKGMMMILLLFAVIFPAIVPAPAAFPVFIIVFGLAVGVFAISLLEDHEDRKFLFRIFIYCYLARIIVALLLHIVSIGSIDHPGFFIDDGWGYSENGATIAGGLKRGIPLQETIVKSSGMFVYKQWSVSGTISYYDYLNGIVYLFTGKSPLSMLFLNCMFGALTVLFIYFIAKAVFDRRAARLSAILCAFWPSLFLWSTQNLKEPLTIFLVVACIWSIVFFLKRANPVYLLITALALFALAKFRFIIALLVMAALFAHLLFFLYRVIRRQPSLLLVVVPAALLSLFFLGSGSHKILGLLTNEGVSLSNLLNTVDYSRSARAYANLAVLPGYKITSVWSLMVYFPVGLLVVLLAPFPWQLFSLSQIIAAPEMFAWYIMLPFLFKGIWYAFKNKADYLFSIFAYVAANVMMLSVLEGNIGTMFRHRSLMLIFVLIFIAVGITNSRKGEGSVPVR